MSEVTNGWRRCPLGELDRLESMLKSQRQHKTWGYTLAVFALTGIIAFCSWQVASAIIPGLGKGLHGSSSSCACDQSFEDPPCKPGKGCSSPQALE